MFPGSACRGKRNTVERAPDVSRHEVGERRTLAVLAGAAAGAQVFVDVGTLEVHVQTENLTFSFVAVNPSWT